MREEEVKLPQYVSAEELERYLGDPTDSSTLFSFASAVEQDEREEYPEEACRQLKEWSFHHYFIPEEYDGRLKSFEELVSLIRIIARRDPTVAYTNLISFFGAISVWIAGTDEQKRRLVRTIKSNGNLALGFTEKEHGNDLMAYDVTAIKMDDGYLLSGEKWPVSHGTYSQALTIFARTDERGGLRGFSLFLVDKDRLDKSSYKHLPRLKTHGVRGAEISGIRFERSWLPQDALIGSLGSGLELFLKFSQVTRTIVPSVSLGAADTALRATMSFALTRRLYGDIVFAIPHARKVLVDAFLDLLICECQNLAAVRSVQAATEQMTIQAAVNKYYVPTTVENLIHNLSLVLGARYYLREGHWSGIFQKIVRDSAIISIGHITHVYNLKAITQQFREIANHHEKIKGDRNQQVEANLDAIFSLEKPLPAFDPKRLAISNRGRDDVLQGIEISLALIRNQSHQRELDPELSAVVMSLVSDLLEEVQSKEQMWKALENRPGGEFHESPEMYQLAIEFCTLHAAACCLHMWIYNKSTLGEFFVKGEWLVLAIDKLLRSLNPGRPAASKSYVENTAQELCRLYNEDRLFSIIPLQLAGAKGH